LVIPIDELEGYPKRTSVVRYVVYAVVATALLGGAIYGIVAPAPDGDMRSGRPAPDFSLVSLTGEPLTSRQLRGAPVVLNFWASWCAPCREEAPLLEAKWREYRDQGVRFIGVNIRDHAADAREFVDRYGITFPILRDPDQQLAAELGVGIGLPQTFFITEDWNLIATVTGRELTRVGGVQVLGAISEEELDRNIRALLEQDE
jgi:cytochrome c biogenesis protein CcmG/thiol:disulfide interchange protein DsbE